MIRLASLSLKFANKNKRSYINDFLDKYREAMRWFVDILWESDNFKFVDHNTVKQCPVDISARAKQAAAKQALGIINGTIKKHKQRIYVRNKLAAIGEDTTRLNELISKPPSKPEIKNIPANIDSRFLAWVTPSNSFDLFLKFADGKNKPIYIPLKKTKPFNKWFSRGRLKTSCRISNGNIEVIFEVDKAENCGSKMLAIDIGVRHIFSTSDREQINVCPHGHTLSSICKKLSRRKRGSKGFRRAERHRRNYMNWAIKQLNLSRYKDIVVEDIKYLRKGKRTSRELSHFTYREIFQELERVAEELNVSIIRVNPAYTSQKCCKCGHTEAKNRKDEKFKCMQCGHEDHADLNSPQNILASV